MTRRSDIGRKYRDMSRYRRKSKAGSVIATCLALLLVAGSVGALAAASNGFRDWDVKEWSWESLKFWEKDKRKDVVTMDLSDVKADESGLPDEYKNRIVEVGDYSPMFEYYAGYGLGKLFISRTSGGYDLDTDYFGSNFGLIDGSFTLVEGFDDTWYGSINEFSTRRAFVHLQLVDGKSFDHVEIKAKTYKDDGKGYGANDGGLSVNKSDIQYYEGSDKWTTKQYSFDKAQTELFIEASGQVAIQSISFWTEQK